MIDKRWERISEIFESVFLDTPLAEREERIVSSCSGDADLEAEVRRLIASAESAGPLDRALGRQLLLAQVSACEGASDTLTCRSSPVWDFGSNSANPAAAIGAGSLIGGRFRLIGLLGQGGMGQVWEAMDEDLQVRRALKTLHPDMATEPAMADRFRREVERAQSVTHPNVCRVYDLCYEGIVPFLSMELIEGESLAQRIRSGNLPSRSEALLILRQCGEALDVAHKAGVLHRDFKPSNVMLTTDRHGAARAVVMDFGLALPVAMSGRDVSTPGAGTPEYMASEQALGEDLTSAVDIYAFAVVACELLTGKRPRDGGLDLLSGRMRPAFKRCLESNAALRPASCAAFLRLLSLAISRRTVLSTVLGVSAAAAIWSRQFRRAEPGDLSAAVLPFEGSSVTEEATALRESISDGLSGDLARIPHLRVVPRDSTSRFSRSKDSLEDFARQINARYIITGRMTLDGDRVYVSAELVNSSEGRTLWGTTFNRRVADLPEIERSIATTALAQMGFSSSFIPQVTQRSADADRTYRLGRHHLNNRDSESLRKAKHYFGVAAEADKDWAQPRIGLAQTLLAMAEGQDESPVYALPAAREAINRALASDPRSADAYAAQGLLASVYDHDFNAAERNLLTAIDLDPNNVIAHQWYSYTLIKERRVVRAMSESEIALRLDPLSFAAYQNRAAILLYARDYRGLIDLMGRLAELYPTHAFPPVLRAYSFARLGRPLEARRELEISLKIPNPGPTVLRLVGETHALLGEREEARKIAGQLEHLRESGTGVSSAYIAFLYAATDQREEAFRWMEKAWQEGDTFLSLLHVYPSCDGLRSDPRYKSLISRLGIRESMESG
jgi:eukaryotic-like serine/threonine-protein kinase